MQVILQKSIEKCKLQRMLYHSNRQHLLCQAMLIQAPYKNVPYAYVCYLADSNQLQFARPQQEKPACYMQYHRP